VKKKDDNDSTNPARAYTAKKDVNDSTNPASDATPCFSLGARPGAYHPISHRRLAREPVVLNREGGSSAAMAVDDGRGLRRSQETKEMGTR
jgi:hypothetical protein